MRIITPGTPKTPLQEVTTTCGHCGCKFAFTEKDIMREQMTTPPEPRKRIVFLRCPQVGCGLEVGVALP